ncbi:SDR family oxidoreductase [Alteromonas sp. P256]|uniref:SDR family oxidoreductase n=1 Tax=Alteromonas sp. P256 TaxID=3117399 RepID=UPI002FDFC3A2
MTTLQNKIAVITGGNSGIGLAAAHAFIKEGARVVIFGRNQDTLDSAVAELGPKAVGIQGDVTSLADLEKLKAETEMRFGQIDVLFANAGLGVFAPIDSVDEASYDKQFDINVKGVFFTVQTLLPLLKHGASVILTGSAVHEKGIATGSLYFATKAAVRSLSRTLAAELAPKGIRVNNLSPGIVRTNFADRTNLANEDFEGFIDMVASQAPLQRPGTMQEVANAARFLASDESSYMTASDVVVDGGWMNV